MANAGELGLLEASWCSRVFILFADPSALLQDEVDAAECEDRKERYDSYRQKGRQIEVIIVCCINYLFTRRHPSLRQIKLPLPLFLLPASLCSKLLQLRIAALVENEAETHKVVRCESYAAHAHLC